MSGFTFKVEITIQSSGERHARGFLFYLILGLLLAALLLLTYNLSIRAHNEPNASLPTVMSESEVQLSTINHLNTTFDTLQSTASAHRVSVSDSTHARKASSL